MLNNRLFSSIYSYIYKNHINIILILILLFSFFTKAYNLAHPDTYVFDEIYYGFTAEEYAKGNVKAFIWDYPAPKGFAYSWDHPPLGREIMAIPIWILGKSSFSRRVVPLCSGVLLSFVIFKISLVLFPKKPIIALISAFLLACDGLLFTLSRIALVDSTLTLLITTSIYFLLKKNYYLSALFWGAASACKWSGLFLAPYIALIVFTQLSWKFNQHNFKKIFTNNLLTLFKTGFIYLIIGSLVYLTSYLPVFLNYGYAKFIDIQKQAYWYHSRLKATHPAQSKPYTWPLNITPVWFWVEYKEDTIANIYALGHPLIFWCGILSIVFIFIVMIRTKNLNLFYLLLAYFSCWIQWIFSPRIMFLYHYLPAVPFLCLALAFVFDYITISTPKFKYFVALYLFFIFLTFCYFYPFWSGMPIPKERVDSFRWLKTWK